MNRPAPQVPLRFFTGLIHHTDCMRIGADVEHDGESGLWRAKEGSYDVIVLDIMLSGLNGHQVCDQLRKAEV